MQSHGRAQACDYSCWVHRRPGLACPTAPRVDVGSSAVGGCLRRLTLVRMHNSAREHCGYAIQLPSVSRFNLISSQIRFRYVINSNSSAKDGLTIGFGA